MIFLTVGTQFPFDRLVKAVDDILDDGLVNDELFAQIGASSYQPRNFESVESLDKRLFDGWFQKASAVISHAGTGVIAMASEDQKPLLVMPRLRKYGEVVHDHQVDIARKFEGLGHILVAYDVQDLPESVQKLKDFVPRRRVANPKAVSDRIRRYLDELTESR